MHNEKRLALLLFAVILAIFQMQAQPDEDCMMCHEDEGLTKEWHGKTISMYVNYASYSSSAHSSLECILCHKDLKGAEFPHNENLITVKCGSCHIGYDEQMKNDIHKTLNVNFKGKRLSCKLCHGTHYAKKISRVKDKSKEFCGNCHTEDVLNSSYHFKSGVNEACIECHESPNHNEDLKKSVHKDLKCSNCHGFVVNNMEKHKEGDHMFSTADCYLCHSTIAHEHKESIHGISLDAGMTETAHCWDCHGSHTIIKTTLKESPVYPSNLVKTCGNCHDDPEFNQKHFSSVKQPGKMYENSVHGKLVRQGREDAPGCINCHGIHNIKNRIQPGSLISTVNISKLCSECHKEIAEEYEQSIHWMAVKKGVDESPTCNDCHSEHAVLSINSYDKSKRDEMKRIQEITCLECHQNLLLSERFGIEGQSAGNYQDSYHGLAVMRGDEDAAMCVDCHGVHKILPEYHNESDIHADNVVATCRKCHPGASDVFSKSYSHSSMEDESAKGIEDIVGTIYFWLIVLVIGGMAAHNMVIFIYDLRKRRKEINKEIRIPRFNKNELIQHVILLTSFTILAITGFQLKYPDSWWSEGLSTLGLNEVTRQWTHRISAVIMMGLSVYHVIYLFATARGRDVLKSLFLKVSDFKEAIHNILYHLHIRKDHPKFENYNYIEKAEYWALIWGTIVMGVTGFILWFPTVIGDWAPLWVIKVSEIVHFYEAVLASLAIIVWHWFFVMFRPQEYPMSFTCIDGKMTMVHYKEEHKMRFIKVMTEWVELKQGKKKMREITHFGRMFINAVEKTGVNTDDFISTEIEKEKDLKEYLSERNLI